MRTDQLYATEIEAERRDWYELAGLVRSLTPAECLVPGYYRDPDWSVRDVAGHLRTWLAEAEVQLERITAGIRGPRRRRRRPQCRIPGRDV